MSGEPNIFADDEPLTTTEDVSPEAPDTGPARDEAGRFAAKETGDTEPLAPETAPPAVVTREAGYAPLAAVLDEREKRQRIEQENTTLRQQLAAYQRQQEPQQLPDPIENPQDFVGALVGQFQQMSTANSLKMSRFLAEKDFGADVVSQTMDWLNTQPYAVGAQFLSEPSPFHAAVQHHKQHQAAAERAAPDFEAKLREKIKAELMAEMGTPAVAAPSTRTPPPSMAREPGGAGASPGPVVGHPLFS